MKTKLSAVQRNLIGATLCEGHAASYGMTTKHVCIVSDEEIQATPKDEPVLCDECGVAIMRRAGVL